MLFAFIFYIFQSFSDWDENLSLDHLIWKYDNILDCIGQLLGLNTLPATNLILDTYIMQIVQGMVSKWYIATYARFYNTQIHTLGHLWVSEWVLGLFIKHEGCID